MRKQHNCVTKKTIHTRNLRLQKNANGKRLLENHRETVSEDNVAEVVAHDDGVPVQQIAQKESLTKLF